MLKIDKEPRSGLASAEYLRSAQSLLIIRVDSDHLHYKLMPYISTVERGWDEVIDEGYDPDHSPPVYWRVVKRGDDQFYCSTFLATRDEVIKCWGTGGLAYCDPATGMAVARMETKFEGDWSAPDLEDQRSTDPKRKEALLYRQLDSMLAKGDSVVLLPPGRVEGSFDDLIVALRGTPSRLRKRARAGRGVKRSTGRKFLGLVTEDQLLNGRIITENNGAPHAASVGGPKAIDINNRKCSSTDSKRKELPLYRQLDSLLGKGDAAVLLPPGRVKSCFDDLIVVLRGTQIPDDFLDFYDCKSKLEVLP
jgi:hypothetical protein